VLGWKHEHEHKKCHFIIPRKNQFHKIKKYDTSINQLDGTSGKKFASGEGFNPKPIKPPKHCQQLATAATL